MFKSHGICANCDKDRVLNCKYVRCGENYEEVSWFCCGKCMHEWLTRTGRVDG